MRVQKMIEVRLTNSQFIYVWNQSLKIRLSLKFNMPKCSSESHKTWDDNYGISNLFGTLLSSEGNDILAFSTQQNES